MYRKKLLRMKYFSDSPFIPDPRIVRRNGVPGVIAGVNPRNQKTVFMNFVVCPVYFDHKVVVQSSSRRIITQI